jgi:hypothetical protein
VVVGVVVRVAVVAILVVAELRVMTLPLFRKTKEKTETRKQPITIFCFQNFKFSPRSIKFIN